jgi:hypothetical protein
MIATRALARSSKSTSSLVWLRRAAGTSAYQSGSAAKWAMPGAASTLSAVIVVPSLMPASK